MSMDTLANFLWCLSFAIAWFLNWCYYRGLKKLQKDFEDAHDKINKIITKPGKQAQISVALEPHYDSIKTSTRDQQAYCVWWFLLFLMTLVIFVTRATEGTA